MTNQERAAGILADWADSEGGLTAIDNDYGGDMAGAAEALADAGLIAGEYVELAPENRLGVGATKEHVIISDNITRTTIKITHDIASDLITALLMVKSYREDNND